MERMEKKLFSIENLSSLNQPELKKDFWRYLFLGLLCTFIGLILPQITAYFIDNVIPDASKSQAVQICLLVLLCNLSFLIAGIARYFESLRMEAQVESKIESAFMDKLLKLPVSFFKNYSSGDLAARTITVSKIQKQLYGIALSVFMNFIFSFVYLIQEFNFSPYFAKWGILFCLLPVLLSLLLCLISYRWEKQIVQGQGKNQGMLRQFFKGIEKIKNTNSEKRFIDRWTLAYAKEKEISYKLGFIGVINSLINSVYPAAVCIFFYYLYGKTYETHELVEITTGNFMGFLCAYSLFQRAFIALADSLLRIRKVLPLSEQIKPILQSQPEFEYSFPEVQELKGNIEVNHVNFRYGPEAPLVLKDINFSVKPGEFVAVVGASGAGKSTLMRLLLGFEKAESGSVFYDNQDISAIDLGSLRRKLGVVLQNDTVIRGTILQNILGNSGLKEEDAWEAAKKVSLDKDIKEMPMGMQTMLTAGGAALSGGQLQRLIIARAIIRQPKLLIFDEATSALDNLTQNEIRKSLDSLKVTRIIIAHRLSTIINADKIYVMKDGEIIESGTYNQLIKEKGYFAELAERQKV